MEVNSETNSEIIETNKIIDKQSNQIRSNRSQVNRDVKESIKEQNAHLQIDYKRGKSFNSFKYPENEFMCKFCGGKSCHHEIYTNNPKSVMKGIDTDWLTPNIMASQRPSSRLIKEYNLIEQFKSHEITTIMNLQMAGEHPNCGDGIHKESGFSYLPDEFYKHGIYFYNFGWPDLGVTDFGKIMKVISTLNFTINEQKQKVLVHCHAGRGRTAIVICCYLIYFENYEAQKAINHFKKTRRISLGNKKQTDLIKAFAQFIKYCRTQFVIHKMSYDDLIQTQQKAILDSQIKKYQKVPWLIYHCFKRIRELVKDSDNGFYKVMYSFFQLNNPLLVNSYGPWDKQKITEFEKLKIVLNNQNFQYDFNQVDDP